MSDLTYLGKGIYGIAEAARLLRRPTAQVGRWANGYKYRRAYDLARSAPVLQTARADKAVITFHELIELFFLREFTSAGVPLQHVRDTATALAAEYGEHPFAAKKLLTNGKKLIAISERGLIMPSTCQLIADFADELVDEVEFKADIVNLWWPKQGERAVVVDPTRALGEPILDATGTPTRTVFRTYQREQDFDRVADFYDLTAAQEKKVVEFELRFSNAA